MTAPTVSTVALLSPGDMGHSVGRMLRHHDMPVITCLEGRSSRSAELAETAGLTPVDSIREMVEKADLFISIVPPATATDVARTIAEALRSTRTSLVYSDWNAISPETTREVGRIVGEAGATFVDGGIIGPPPKIDGAQPRIYISGPDTAAVESLAGFGLDVRTMSREIGHASGLKMCYAALTKGTTALGTELMVAAHALGISDALRDELEHSQVGKLRDLETGIPGMPPKAYRWVGEMEEIAKTFEDVGLTPKMLLGAADMYRLVGETPLASETPEKRSRGTSLDDVVAILSEALPTRKGD